MQSRVNPQQLVLRVDSATGFATVGWATDLPLGRFIHMELIDESPRCGDLSLEALSPNASAHNKSLHEKLQRACQQACAINSPLIAKQKERYQAKGFFPVPLNLNHPNTTTNPDLFGNYQEAAMAALFRLTGNFSVAWAVVYQRTIVQLRSCAPPKTMEELEYQVWKHHTLKQLSCIPGEILTGKLMVQESGLWFCP